MPRLRGRVGDRRRHGGEDAYVGYRQHACVRVRETRSPAAGRTPWRCGKECGGLEHDRRAPAARSWTPSYTSAAPAVFAFRRYGRGARRAAARIRPRAQSCRLTHRDAWSGGLTVSWPHLLADNKLALNAGWDLEMLSLEIGELGEAGFDLSLTGFDEFELGELFAERTQGRTDPDDAPEPPAHPVAEPGDLWVLGRHRLLCGDSTV